jgi:large subunit ribosomal protein L17
MRHNNKTKHLGRTPSHRRAMLSNLVTSLFENGRIRTTEARAKEGRRLAEKLITFARRGDLNARRQTAKVVRDKIVLKKLFDEIGPRFQERPGGYTRIVKLNSRLGDRAPMVLFELLGEPKATAKKADNKTKKSASSRKKSGVDKEKAEGKEPSAKKSRTKGKLAPSVAPAEKKRRSGKSSSRKPS